MQLYALFVALTVFTTEQTEGLGACNRVSPCRYRCYYCDPKPVDLCKCETGEYPSDWTDRRKVISFDILEELNNHRVNTHQLMFCDNMMPKRFCKDQNAHSLRIRYQNWTYASAKLSAAWCRCKDNEPLVITQTYKLGKEYRDLLSCRSTPPLCSHTQASSVRFIDIEKGLVKSNHTESFCRCEESGYPAHRWSDRNRVLTIDDSLLAYGHNKTIEHAFCMPHFSTRTILCTPSERLWREPVRITRGPRSKPRVYLDYARCRCPDDQPIMLKRSESTKTDDWEWDMIEQYVCPFDVPQLLNEKDVCILKTPTLYETTIEGTCPPSLACVLEPRPVEHFWPVDQRAYCTRT